MCSLAPESDAGTGTATFSEESVARGISYSIPYRFGTEHSWGRGLAFADLDGDSDPDLVLTGGTGWVVGVFRNDGGTFVDVSGTTLIPAVPGATGVNCVDYDGDGDLDIYIACWCEPNCLFRNEGGFVFTDVSVASQIDDGGAGVGTSWADIDGDGWLDLYAPNRTGSTCGPNGDSNVENTTYMNNGSGTFSTLISGAEDIGAVTYQGTFFDYDRDGDPDIFVAEDKGIERCLTGGHNKLYENNNGVFTEVSAAVGADGCVNAMCATIGDVEHDGYLDVYVTNTPEGNHLNLNNAGLFTESAGPMGAAVHKLGWGSVFLDAENDGDLDLYVCNQTEPNELLVNNGATPPVFNASLIGGSTPPGQAFCTAVADIDDDGDLDIAMSSINGSVVLYVNTTPNQGNWVKVRVVGRHPNLHAVGAIIDVHDGPTLRSKQVLAGSGFKTQDELTQHFGLGSATSVDIDVIWPDGSMKTITGAAVGTTHVVTPPCDGDADGNGEVAVGDITFIIFRLGDTGTPGSVEGDVNGDGVVDTGDIGYVVFRLGTCN